MNYQATRATSHGGYAMAALLVSIAVMGVLMSVLMPVWRTAVQREREAELVFRGEQYARAIGLFQRKFAGGFPPSLDLLVEQKFLRKKYTDPVSDEADFRVLYQADVAALQGQAPGAARPGEIVGAGSPAGAAAPGGEPRRGELRSTSSQRSPSGFGAQGMSGGGVRGGVVGVASTNTAKSFRLYNGRDRYDQWLFVYAAPTLGRPQGPGPRQRPVPGGPGGVGSPRPGAVGSPRPGAVGAGPTGIPR